MQWSSGNKFSRVVKAVDPSGNPATSSWFGFIQGQLKDRLPVTNPELTTVTNKNSLTEEEKTAVKNAIYAKNAKVDHRIDDIEVRQMVQQRLSTMTEHVVLQFPQSSYSQ